MQPSVSALVFPAWKRMCERPGTSATSKVSPKRGERHPAADVAPGRDAGQVRDVAAVRRLQGQAQGAAVQTQQAEHAVLGTLDADDLHEHGPSLV
jgi:hypothetical protein